MSNLADFRNKVTEYLRMTSPGELKRATQKELAREIGLAPEELSRRLNKDGWITSLDVKSIVKILVKMGRIRSKGEARYLLNFMDILDFDPHDWDVFPLNQLRDAKPLSEQAHLSQEPSLLPTIADPPLTPQPHPTVVTSPYTEYRRTMATQQPPLHIFCGYAHEDKVLFQQLKKALAVPINQGTITVWDDKELLPGDLWERKIEQQLNMADIILLLISPAFMASNYCWSKEMQWAITRSNIGAARVIPILGKQTPNWETTPLGKVQSLPTGIKPITTWRDRGQAFADIVERLSDVIHQMQQEDRYSVKEYFIALRFSLYESQQEKVPAQVAAKYQAEQWVETVSQLGILQVISDSPEQKEWKLTRHQQDCQIIMQWNYRGRDTLQHPFRSADIFLTSLYPAFLDQIIEAGKFPYWLLRWTLLNDLNVPMLAKLIFEETEKHAINSSLVIDTDGVEQTHHAEYALPKQYNRPMDPIRITLTSRGPLHPGDPSLPANICLVHENSQLGGFYRALTLFSVQKLLLKLRGKIPSTEWYQLIDEAYMPYRGSANSHNIRGKHQDLFGS